jgi:hypothetical protein
MTKAIAILVLVTLVTAGCGKKKPAPGQGPAPGSGSDPAAGLTADAASSSVPPDPAQVAIAAASAEVAKLVTPAAAADPQARAGRATKLIDAVVELTRDVPRDAWNPRAVFEAVGGDRTALFLWVRDRTALVPYRGALRGPVGVVMDRLGNSLDRALLLADLLKRAGRDVRLASGTLDEAAVARLAASASARSRPALPDTRLDDAALLARLVKDLGIDAAAFRAGNAKLDAQAGALADRTRKRIAEQAAALAKLVPATAPPAARDTSAFADHWWVQVEDSGVWIDLDPSLPDAEPGQALAAAGETLAPDAIGQDRRHTLTIRVIGEVWRDQVREETLLVDHTFAPADHWGQRISVTNVAFDLPDPDALLASPAPLDALKAALATQTEWLPVLRIGDAVVARMSVTDAGELYDATDPNGNTNRLARVVQRATKAGVGGATDLLGTLPDGEGEPVSARPPAAEHSGFTAEWIEYELRAPGAPPAIVRRTVFDGLALAAGAAAGATAGAIDRSIAKPVKLSDAARLDRQLALGGETELLPMFARIPAAFVIDRAVVALTAARPTIAGVASLGGKMAALSAQLSKLAPLPGVLYDLALARFDWGGLAEQVYLDRLDVLVHRQRLVGSDLRLRHEIDIVANAVAVWPTAADPRIPRIVQGVADTAAEAAVLGCAAKAGCPRGVNTSDQFAASSAGWIVTRPDAPPAFDHLPGAVRALAAADHAAGYAVIAPPGATAATWWRVHPETGETLGLGARGGITATEYVALQNAQILWATGLTGCMVVAAIHVRDPGSFSDLVWCSIAATLGFAGGSLGVVVGSARGLSLAIQMFSTLVGTVVSSGEP